MASDETTTAMWNESQRAFQGLLNREMADTDDIDDSAVSRRVGILEAAAVIEDMKARAERAPNSSPEIVNLLDVLLQQVMTLLTVEGGEK